MCLARVIGRGAQRTRYLVVYYVCLPYGGEVETVRLGTDASREVDVESKNTYSNLFLEDVVEPHVLLSRLVINRQVLLNVTLAAIGYPQLRGVRRATAHEASFSLAVSGCNAKHVWG